MATVTGGALVGVGLVLVASLPFAREVSFALGMAVAVVPVLVVFVASVWHPIERPRTAHQTCDQGRMTESGVPYVHGR